MSNIKEQIRQEIERQIRSVNEKQDANPAMPKYRWHMYEGMKEAFIDMNYFLDSLPEEKPIEKGEKIEALIVCDIMEATAKRVNIDKQDKDKEEEAMLEKINYLRNLGLNE